MFLEHMNLVQTAEFDELPWQMKDYLFLQATFTVFWLNIAFIAVISGERVTHGPLVKFSVYTIKFHNF